jgi:hypothetical protein
MRSFRQRQNKRIVASVPDPMRERGVNTQFPIHDLIESQQKRLGLRRSDLALRIGFKNVAKGLRRIDGVCHGDLDSPGAKMALDNRRRARKGRSATCRRWLEFGLSRNTAYLTAIRVTADAGRGADGDFTQIASCNRTTSHVGRCATTPLDLPGNESAMRPS